MAPSTRAIYRPSTPTNEIHTAEADTIKRTKFFDLWDRKPEEQSRRAFCAENKYHESTARKWLNQRKNLGSPAYRRQRKRLNILGRKSKVQKATTKWLADPSKNPLSGERLEVMCAEYKLGVGARQLQRRLTALTNKARRYKAAWYRDELSEETERAREEYGNRHKGKSVEDLW